MKYGLWCKNLKDWMMENKNDIAYWDSDKEADKWRRNHTVHPDSYEVKKLDKRKEIRYNEW